MPRTAPLAFPVSALVTAKECMAIPAWNVVANYVERYMVKERPIPKWVPKKWFDTYVEAYNKKKIHLDRGKYLHEKALGEKWKTLRELLMENERGKYKGSEISINTNFQHIELRGRVDWMEGIIVADEEVHVTRLVDLKFPRSIEAFKLSYSLRLAKRQVSFYAVILEKLGMELEHLKEEIIACPYPPDSEEVCVSQWNKCMSCSRAVKINGFLNLRGAESVIERLVDAYQEGIKGVLGNDEYKKEKTLCKKCRHRLVCQGVLPDKTIANMNKKIFKPLAKSGSRKCISGPRRGSAVLREQRRREKGSSTISVSSQNLDI